MLSNNGKLKQAQDSRSSLTFSDDIKALVKGGCEEIYNSEPNENNLADFKAYCSLWLQDKITGFITEQHGDSKWQAKVNGLKDYTKGLISEFTTIENAITNSNVSEKQQEIKNLCDKLKENMFESETTTEFNNTKSFCTSAVIA
ncbi:hypothetical protein A6V39_04490 [Candidatus Mycoplasma haematobovis]|uniref:Uncharacterized protein n=1 Tax=Candidatus Mycoplasma haematobovis TaxID=432608 RepID=A0A1A9QCH3_9MOLU|nr:hypothetical protein [Candidatus Mycoplasma haematobovis]OAL10143.1 hypothetical protein A6V39_04490 [Candidatus Mycoplasma haematobovis]